ncbi:MAG: efflux RND transporter periplasmic adaptor subunit [Ectothiorhodospiraceae bacterium]|nr:efflux RND transporter periplasmic adaptor subunit [Ectothiorhodospiraceae bacterium]
MFAYRLLTGLRESRFLMRQSIPFLVLFLAASVVASSLASAEPPLATSKAEYRMLPRFFVTDAVIEAVHQATLAAETTGRIKAIYFDVDDVVEKGVVLLRFTDKTQQAGVARSQAQLKEAIARLTQAAAEDIRIQEVYKKKLVAKSALDKTQADVKAAQQRVKAAEADNKKAAEQLEYTVVRAPYAGIVVKRHVSVGERVQPGAALMTGFSLAKLRATASVPQSVVEAVRQQGEVSISIGRPVHTVGTSESTTLVSVTSKNITVYPYADAASHNFTVRTELASVPAGFYPGMFAKAKFVIGEVSRLLVPKSAVVHRSEVTAVYVVNKKGRVGFRAVRIGQQFGDEKTEGTGYSGETIEVLAGLQAGEHVALNPVQAGVLLKSQRVK